MASILAPARSLHSDPAPGCEEAPELAEEVSIEGTLRRYVFRNEESGFAIARIELDDANQLPVTVKGVLSGVSEGERVRVHGKWVDDARFGRQVQISSFMPVMPSTARGVEDFLRGDRVKGIGKVFAKRLVAHFGEKTLEVLENQPERLTEVDGIGAGRARTIVGAWKDSQVDRETLIFLQGVGLSGALANRVARKYGKRTVEVVRANPYRLAADVGGIGFRTADAMARALGIEGDSPHRLRAGLLFVLAESVSDGHCFLPGDEVTGRATKLLDQPWELLRPRLADLEGEGTVIIERAATGPRVWLTERHDAEELVAWRMRSLLARDGPAQVKDPQAAVRWAEDRVGMTLSDAQRAAVAASVERRVLVITGGPGTGKTTIVKAVLELWERLGLRVRLAAPTGRAAKRLEESSGRMASTLHRMLEFSPKEGRFLRDLENPLQCDAVVVDEASMVDLDLAAALLAAVPDGARLLLVGDVDQLPSVGPGRVLADLIDSEAIPVARLDAIFRQEGGSFIVKNAHRILHGQPLVQAPGSSGDFYFIEREDPDAALKTVAHLVVQRIPRAWGLDPLADVQVLVPMRRGNCGAEALNLALRRGLAEARKDAAAMQETSRRPQLHDRVMQTRNNYDKDVFNGDVGQVIVVTDRGKALRVRFDDGREMEYAGQEIDELELAYAVTIHKSQGSEYPAVVIPLLTQHYRMLQRNLLYTAVTRGKKLVVLVGSRRAVDIAIGRAEAGVRFTSLAERLREAVGG
ncbi:MAG: ATP-dependent RecD-like DNA helicase [Deltaproteobacteria bacterium]|nr:ATP-dependent RecD-like DNA helicase [Deltaproteobacteria bacterium]